MKTLPRENTDMIMDYLSCNDSMPIHPFDLLVDLNGTCYVYRLAYECETFPKAIIYRQSGGTLLLVLSENAKIKVIGEFDKKYYIEITDINIVKGTELALYHSRKFEKYGPVVTSYRELV